MINREIALVLAGGRGQRMGVLCESRAKPVLPFGGSSRIIDFSLNNCIRSSIGRIGVLVDYRRETMTDYLKGWHATHGDGAVLHILPPMAGSYAGTADAVRQNIDLIEKYDADIVLVLAGDHVYEMDYRQIIAFHNLMKADVTVGVTKVPREESHRFGMVRLDSDSRIFEFKEKSSVPQSNLASMGIYIFNREKLVQRLTEDASAPGSLHDFGYNILPRMVKTDRVYAYEFRNYWYDIGTVPAYYQVNMGLLAPEPLLILPEKMPVNSPANISQQGRQGNVVNSLIGPGCVIEGRVENSILSPGVHVGEQSVIMNSIVMANTAIGYHSVIDGCILDEGATVGDFCYVGLGANIASKNPEVSVLGRRVSVPDRTAIGRRCNIGPGTGPEVFRTRRVPSGSTIMLL
jgi:glucose-1-phosphate adenylyltransferase